MAVPSARQWLAAVATLSRRPGPFGFRITSPHQRRTPSHPLPLIRPRCGWRSGPDGPSPSVRRVPPWLKMQSAAVF